MSDPKANISALNVARVREVLDYDPVTGFLTWRKQLGPRGVIGSQAGGVRADGYRSIMIDGVPYKAQVLAWLHYYGEAPAHEIDHRNLNKDANWISNLRAATREQNARNSPRLISNTSGFKGVAVYPNGRYRAQIKYRGKQRYLGTFVDPEKAYAAYCRAARELHGEFARLT